MSKETGGSIVFLDWGDRLGVLDFTGDQYCGWIRNRRVLIPGERGEIVSDAIHYLKDFRTPIALDLRRDVMAANGDLHGFHLRGIQVGDEWEYTNSFAPASLPDGGIAIGTCLVKMGACVHTGQEFYPLAEACQDHCLNLVAQQALSEGREISAQPQEWTG